jgi:Fe-S-cluster containining protein
MADPIPDCITCGACCASPFVGEGYIQVNAEEEKRLDRLGLPVLEVMPGPDDRIVLLGTKENRQGDRVCVALDGRVGKQVFCTIYEHRPSLCRQFEAGSPECFEARRAAGVH